MPAPASFDYAIIRVVPRVEREEFLNVGVIVFCLARDFLAAKVSLNSARLMAFDGSVDAEAISRHLNAIPQIAAGGIDAGPIGRLSAKERFHWLVAPRSTQIQVSAVHAGLCESPELALEQLLERRVSLQKK